MDFGNWFNSWDFSSQHRLTSQRDCCFLYDIILSRFAKLLLQKNHSLLMQRIIVNRISRCDRVCFLIHAIVVFHIPSLQKLDHLSWNWTMEMCFTLRSQGYDQEQTESKARSYPTTSWHRPTMSARYEHRSHPLV